MCCFACASVGVAVLVVAATILAVGVEVAADVPGSVEVQIVAVTVLFVSGVVAVRTQQQQPPPWKPMYLCLDRALSVKSWPGCCLDPTRA